MARYRPNTKELMTTMPVTLNRFGNYVPPLDLPLDPIEAIMLCSALGAFNDAVREDMEEMQKKGLGQEEESDEAMGIAVRSYMALQLLAQRVYERLVKKQTERGWVNNTVAEAEAKGIEVGPAYPQNH